VLFQLIRIRRVYRGGACYRKLARDGFFNGLRKANVELSIEQMDRFMGAFVNERGPIPVRAIAELNLHKSHGIVNVRYARMKGNALSNLYARQAKTKLLNGFVKQDSSDLAHILVRGRAIPRAIAFGDDLLNFRYS